MLFILPNINFRNENGVKMEFPSEIITFKWRLKTATLKEATWPGS